MKKLFFISMTILLSACNGSLFGEKEGPKFMVESPYGSEEYHDMITPDVYAIAATRATNRMLDQTSDIYDKTRNPKLYIAEIKKSSNSMPDGLYYAKDVTKQIIDGSRTFVIVNNINDSDYYLDIKVREIPVTTSETPIVEYKMTLFDKDNVKINEWTQNIKQLQNDDQSWW